MIIKIPLQGEEVDFGKAIENLKKMSTLLGHHMSGIMAIRKRFEAMLG